MIISNSNQKAFTLIDILLTSAIISLLSSIFLFQVSEAKRKADDSRMKVEAQQVSNAIALYKNDDNGRVPLSVTSVAGTAYTETALQYQEAMQTLVTGKYIAEIPKSPDGQSYTYATDANNNAFFAFKLKQGNVSGNRKNSCSVAVTGGGGVKTFTGCQNDWSNTCVQSSSVQCFPGGNSNLSLYVNNCSCSNGMNSGGVVVALNPSIMPNQVCSYALSCSAGNFTTLLGTVVPYGPSWSLSPVSSMCNYTVSNTSNIPACNGSSNSDYCQCS